MTTVEDKTPDMQPTDDVEDPINEVEGKIESSEEEDLKKEQEDDAAEEGDDVDDEELSPFDNFRSMIFKGMEYAFYVLIVVYLLAAFIIDFHRAIAFFVITVLVVVYNIYAYWAGKNEETILAAEDKVLSFLEKSDTDIKYTIGLTGFLIGIMAIILASTVRDGRNMISLFGMIVLLGLTWLFSWKPSKVKVRPVVGALFIQFVFGYCVIRTSWGLEAMEFLSDIFVVR